MEVELARERAAAAPERAGDHEVVGERADRRGEADAVLVVAFEGPDRGQRGFEQTEALPDADAPPVALLDGAGIDRLGDVFRGEQRPLRALRPAMRQAVGEEELVEPEVESVRLLLQLSEGFQVRLQELPLAGSFGCQRGVFLVVEPCPHHTRRERGAQGQEEDVDEGDDADEGDLHTAEEEVAHPPADVARVDLNLEAPALGFGGRAGPEAAQELHAGPAAEPAGGPSGFSRSTSTSRAWLATTSHSSRCTSLLPATTLPPRKYPAPPSRSVTTPPASSIRTIPAPMSHGERRNSKKPS